MVNENKMTIEDLLELKGADREAKAYAFLYAAFKRTEISANPVRDALDCLIPFIVPYTNRISGKQVTSENVQSYLNDNFGFEIPVYAVDQLIQVLQQHGYVEYRRNVKAHFAVSHESAFDVVKSEIETEFDDITAQLDAYAKSVGFTLDSPPSGDWGSALVRFLRVRTEKTSVRVTKVKNVILDPKSIETAIIGGFIRGLHDQKDDHHFKKILNIFMGVLVEDFISSVTEIGHLDVNKPVTVFYDTAVLLRQLGCSGKMLRLATEELTRYLQDLGFQIKYFSGNESEVNGIIDTILYIKDTGKELEGETAAAIASGEVNVTDLRFLKNTFPERLAAFNIFPAGDMEKNAIEGARYQIDEHGFSEFIYRNAQASGRVYGQQNRQNDAGYLATVMRLRRGNRARDLADCGYVFATSNKFLAMQARRFLIEQKTIAYSTFPPIVALGQLATIAWLLKDQTIPPEKAGRELLINCFAAVKPDAEWFGYFREGMEKVTGPLDEFTSQGKNALMMQAARRIAQDESFGNSSIVRQLNMAEILSRAEQTQERIDAEREESNRRIQKENEEEMARIKSESEEYIVKVTTEANEKLEEAVRIAAEEARREIISSMESDRRDRVHKFADRIINWFKLLVLFFLILIIIYGVWLEYTDSKFGPLFWFVTILLSFINIVSLADFLKFQFVEKVIFRLRRWLVKKMGG